MVKVAVIGAGPGGLFFCNAIEHIRRESLSSPDHKVEDVEVICFERSSQPGGIWRAGDSTTTDMYASLWTNGTSHGLEFFDYTFDEAFGKPVHVYLTREELHSYIIGRVQKNCDGDFFEKYVRFMQSVEHVSYDKNIQKFNLQVKDLTNNTVTSHSFDKCIWACGDNGTKNMPENMVKMFRDGDFKGTVMHSSDVANAELFVKSVAGKRILLIGGEFSAEDLALQSIKVGVDKVYVSCRNPYGAAISYTNNWPGDKVEVLASQTPFLVTNEGTCIKFHEVRWTPYGYKRHGTGFETELCDIDTVIFCTGYDVNLSMLDKELNEGFPSKSYKVADTFAVPDGWKMPENEMTTYVGDVPPSDHVRYSPGWLHPSFYNGVLLKNPNMMFVTHGWSYYPLLATDASAWLFAGYVTKRIDMPSVAEMKRRNQEEVLRQLGMPSYRCDMDDNYWKAIESLDIWDKCEKSHPEWDRCVWDEFGEGIKLLAGVFQEAKHPFQIGTRQELNESGQLLFDFGSGDYHNRFDIVHTDEDKEWRTFRDDPRTERFYSMFTGTKAVPLDDKWMSIDKQKSI